MAIHLPVPRRGTSRRILTASALVAAACAIAAVQWSPWAEQEMMVMTTVAQPTRPQQAVGKPEIDHSVIQLSTIADEPDTTGVSIAAYER